MLISDMTTEQWIGNKNEYKLIENPNWTEIKTAISELDGDSKTLVTIAIDDEKYLTIGGGKSGQYVVAVTFDNITFYNLVNPRKSPAIQKLIIGGQLGNYPEQVCTDFPSVILATKTFAETGEMERSLIWEIDALLPEIGILVET
jgi:Immunity protein Imm1